MLTMFLAGLFLGAALGFFLCALLSSTPRAEARARREGTR
jgi:hypothetical protein